MGKIEEILIRLESEGGYPQTKAVRNKRLNSALLAIKAEVLLAIPERQPNQEVSEYYSGYNTCLSVVIQSINECLGEATK
jgi:hypothetical protein